MTHKPAAHHKTRTGQFGFIKNDAGSVTTFFGLCMTVLLATIGAGIDFGRVHHQKAIASSIADATVMAAVAAAVEADKAKLKKPEDIGKLAGETFWAKNAQSQHFSVEGKPEIKLWEPVANEWRATVKFDERYSTHFMSLFGQEFFPIKVFAEASSAYGEIQEYWDIHLAVDDSASMGIGATAAIQAQMKADREMQNCAFACHFSSNARSPDTFSVARRKGYKLRLDVVDEAIDAVIGKLDKISTGTNLRVALHGINDSFRQLVTLTSNLRNVQNHTIDMALTTSSKGNTNFRIGFTALTAQVGTAGDGSAANKSKKMAIIVTDGIHDHNINEINVVTNISKDYKLGPISPSFCSSMKSRGVKVGVLYVPYLTPVGYEGYTRAYINNVPKMLQQCASPDMFMEASQSDQIAEMLGNLVQEAFGSDSDLRLTQ